MRRAPYFWGMTMVIIKVPDIFQHSADALTNFGYQYRLSKTISPLTDEYTVVDSVGGDSDGSRLL